MTLELHDNKQWLCFLIEDETYAHPVNKIREVHAYMAAVPVPGAPSYIDGVLNIRGEIVTIVSSRKLLGIDETDQHRHIVIIESKKGLVGISVDEVVKITLLDLQNLVPVEQKNTLSPIYATLKHKQQLIILADFERCFNQMENYE